MMLKSHFKIFSNTLKKIILFKSLRFTLFNKFIYTFVRMNQVQEKYIIYFINDIFNNRLSIFSKTLLK